MKINELIGRTVNFRIKEVFGTVKATLNKLDIPSGIAHISFKSFGSMYTMIVPITAISTKNTEGESTPITANKEVIVTLDTSEVVSKKGIVEDISSVGILVRFGNNLRLLTIDSIKELRISSDEEDTSKPAKPAKAAPAPTKAPVKAPVKAPPAPRRG